MTHKRFVIVALAIGLLLAIGCVVSQMEVFTNPLLEAQPLQSPSQGQPITQPLVTLQSGPGSSNVAWTGSVNIDKYDVVQFSSPQPGEELAGITCYSSGKIVGYLYFLEDIAGVKNLQSADGTNLLYFPYNRYNDILDMLRNNEEINLVFFDNLNARIESHNIEVQKAP